MYHGNTEETVTTRILTLELRYHICKIPLTLKSQGCFLLYYKHPRWQLIKLDQSELSKGLILI